MGDYIITSTPDELFSELFPYEIGWRDRQEFLESRGYLLRPRYRPGWTPSWRGTGQHPRHFEDSILLPLRPNLIDATRISDGRMVYLKRVRTGDQESQIAVVLTSPPLSEDPMNHCVPILDIFLDEDDRSVSYMVMPFLRLMDDPEFECVEDVLEFGEQMLEGLAFLHRNGVAHRDCSRKNLMMDASPLYPQGFHPVRDIFLQDIKTFVQPLSRIDAPVKYYYVDFGISVRFPLEAQPKLALGADGRDQEPPELSEDVPYDPFKLDIFILGNVFRKEIYDKYSNVDFLCPVFKAMIRPEPSTRPDAAEVLQQWKTMRSGMAFLRRQWWLRAREGPFLISDASSAATTAVRLVKGLFY